MKLTMNGLENCPGRRIQKTLNKEAEEWQVLKYGG
jgi:hypothetical protein